MTNPLADIDQLKQLHDAIYEWCVQYQNVVKLIPEMKNTFFDGLCAYEQALQNKINVLEGKH